MYKVDFNNIFNIVFVSICAALILLFLISVIVVAVKGKRKCGAGDVLLRILATLVFIVSIFMVACSVLTMTSGSIAIVVAPYGKAAALVIDKSVTELPMPELFAILSTSFGFGLSAILFILSLTALIVDCLVANKKDKKDKKGKKEPAVKKSPEQLKREAELERIRRIGESAVRKTERVAEKAEKTEKDETVEKPENAQDAEAPIEEQEPAADWREEQPAETHSGFVGIKDEPEDDAFDSFDTFDDEQTVSEEYEQPTMPEPDEDVEGDQYVADDGEYAEEQSDEYAEEQTDEYVEEQADEYAEEQTDEYVEEQADEAYEYAEEQSDSEPTEDIYYDADDGYTYDQAQSDGDEPESEAVTEPESEAVDEAVDETVDEVADEATNEVVDEAAAEVAPELENIEPDRGIYIPEIRTVTPRPTEVKPAAAQQRTTQKAAPTKRPATKPAKPKKSGSGVSQRPVIPPEKKLPVTRRYVILDRHNAVNMFGEYLKERNQAQKDKLKSSINTIIIE